MCEGVGGGPIEEFKYDVIIALRMILCKSLGL